MKYRKVREMLLNGLGIAVVLVMIVGTIIDFNQEEKVYEDTRYYKVVNKDYRDVSTMMFNEENQFMVKVNRYDKNMNRLEHEPSDLVWVRVTQYEYEKIKVGKFYDKNWIIKKTN